jgi:WD repeat-containing protein 48
VYGQDLGDEVADDVKYNYGLMVLRGLFSAWVTGIAGPEALHASGPDGALPPLPLPQYAAAARPPLVASTDAAGVPWCAAVPAMRGGGEAEGLVPGWAADALLRCGLPPGKDAKCAFVLLPAEGEALPSLLQSRLNAPKILQVHKVAAFLAGKLAEAGVSAVPKAVFYRLGGGAAAAGGYANYAQQGQADAGGDASALLHGQPVLELLCGGWAVPHNLTLAAVKKFVWRRADDVVLHYRLQDPLRPAPMPDIQPPDS